MISFEEYIKESKTSINPKRLISDIKSKLFDITKFGLKSGDPKVDKFLATIERQIDEIRRELHYYR